MRIYRELCVQDPLSYMPLLMVLLIIRCGTTKFPNGPCFCLHANFLITGDIIVTTNALSCPPVSLQTASMEAVRISFQIPKEM